MDAPMRRGVLLLGNMIPMGAYYPLSILQYFTTRLPSVWFHSHLCVTNLSTKEVIVYGNPTLYDG